MYRTLTGDEEFNHISRLITAVLWDVAKFNTSFILVNPVIRLLLRINSNFYNSIFASSVFKKILDYHFKYLYL